MTTTFKVTDADIKSKLQYYKTAWSETYQSFVEILNFRLDDLGEPIIRARVPYQPSSVCDGTVLFRICELSRFCL